MSETWHGPSRYIGVQAETLNGQRFYISIISPSVSRHNYTIHDSDVKRIRILWFLVSVLCAFLFVLVGWCESKGKFLFSLPYSAFELKTFRTTKTVHRPGIEPGSPAWQASILPLDHRCFLFTGWTLSLHRTPKLTKRGLNRPPVSSMAALKSGPVMWLRTSTFWRTNSFLLYLDPSCLLKDLCFLLKLYHRV